MLRTLRLAMFLLPLLVLAAVVASLFHVAYYGASRKAPCIVLRGLMFEAWNGGAYYRPGFSRNGGGTRYVRFWPPDGKFVEHWPVATGSTWRVQLPLWMPLVVTSVPAAFAFRGEVRHRRAVRRGTCQKCGYSRAGLDAAAPCPECGAVASAGVETFRNGTFTSTIAADAGSGRRDEGESP